MFGAALRAGFGTSPRRKLRTGLAVPGFVGHTTGGGFGSPAIITPPAGSVGDLILIHLSRQSTQDPPFVQSAGETIAEFSQGVQGTAGWLAGWRLRTGADTTYSFTVPPGNASAFWNCYALSGVDPTNPINTWSQQGDATNPINLPALSVDITNVMLLHFVFMAEASGEHVITPPGGSETVDHNAGHSGVTHAAAREPFAAGGGTGQRIWTLSHNENNHGFLIAAAPIEVAPDKLELETTSDNLLFEDSSGVLLLE